MSRNTQTEIHTDLVLEVAPPEVGHLKTLDFEMFKDFKVV